MAPACPQTIEVQRDDELQALKLMLAEVFFFALPQDLQQRRRRIYALLSKTLNPRTHSVLLAQRLQAGCIHEHHLSRSDQP